MKVCICELPDEEAYQAQAWDALVTYTASTRPSLVVLPEMPFCEWVFVGHSVDMDKWRSVVKQHEAMLGRLKQLSCDWVIGSRPVQRGRRRLNEAFLWSSANGYQPIRSKWYLPDAPTARETLWFDMGDRTFRPIACGEIGIGCQLCSEMMFPEHAREIGWKGAHLIVQPRATGSARRWRAASEMSAVSSGCYIASTNRRSLTHDGFAGCSWLLSPDGETLAETTNASPFLTASLDIAVAEAAKNTYPRDLQKLYCSVPPD